MHIRTWVTREKTWSANIYADVSGLQSRLHSDHFVAVLLQTFLCDLQFTGMDFSQLTSCRPLHCVRCSELHFRFWHAGLHDALIDLRTRVVDQFHLLQHPQARLGFQGMGYPKWPCCSEERPLRVWFSKKLRPQQVHKHVVLSKNLDTK